MRIVVLVKEVPDTYGDRLLDLETGLADREASDRVVDEIVERALEVAMRYADANEGAEVVALSAAPEAATATVRKALAIGADRAILVSDEQLVGADITLTAEALAAVLRRESWDLVIAGDRSTDGSSGVLPAVLAELLDAAALTRLDSVEIEEGRVRGSRTTGDRTYRLSADLPSIISVTERLPEARFPNFKGIMAAKKKPFEVLSLADLGIEGDVAADPRTIMTEISQRPPRDAGVKIVDDGHAGEKLAAYLVENRLA